MPRLAFIGTPPASKSKGKKTLQPTLQSTFPFAIRNAVTAVALSIDAAVSGKRQRQGKKGKNLLLGEQSSISSFLGGKENLPEDNGSSEGTGFFQSSEAAQFFQPAESSSSGGKRKLDPIAAAATSSSKRKSAPAKVPVVKGLVPSLELGDPRPPVRHVCFPSSGLFTFLFSHKSCPKSYLF